MILHPLLFFLTLAGIPRPTMLLMDSGNQTKKELEKRISQLDNSYTAQWTMGQAVTVHVGFYIESLSSVRATDMAFDVDLYLRQSWEEPRLRHRGTKYYTVTKPHLQKALWTPDLYFTNAKQAHFQTVTKPNKLLMVYPDGHIHFSSRIIGTISCNLNLRKYPMDSQNCPIRIMSYAHPDTELRLEWFNNSAIGHNGDIELPEMIVIGVEAVRCDATYNYGQTATTELAGQFSCLVATIKLRRLIGYHLVQTYIPTCLIVTISWISFWIDPAAIPARISLSFTTLLTLATMAAGLRTSLPPVAYAKAIDYWVGMCTLFVFAALLQFAFVNSIVRKANGMREKREGHALADKDELEDPTDRTTQSFKEEKNGRTHDVFQSKALLTISESEVPLAPPEPRVEKETFLGEALSGLMTGKASSFGSGPTMKERRLRKFAHNVDFVSRFLFPGVFVAFNLFYWTFFKPY